MGTLLPWLKEEPFLYQFPAGAQSALADLKGLRGQVVPFLDFWREVYTMDDKWLY